MAHDTVTKEVKDLNG